MKDDLVREIKLAAGVTAVLNGTILKIKGPKGEVTREFVHPKVKIKLEADKVVLESPLATKREKTIIGSFQAHIRNMVKGVQVPHFYTLKVCSGHFPITVSVTGGEVVVKNFLGEHHPRKAKIMVGAEIKVTGADITVSSPDREVAGMMASRIEQLCRITNRDLRVFQDGCYILTKAGKKVG